MTAISRQSSPASAVYLYAGSSQAAIKVAMAAVRRGNTSSQFAQTL